VVAVPLRRHNLRANISELDERTLAIACCIRCIAMGSSAVHRGCARESFESSCDR
jgi:hypothetical protein